VLLGVLSSNIGGGIPDCQSKIVLMVSFPQQGQD